jgi:hypothetical protein
VETLLRVPHHVAVAIRVRAESRSTRDTVRVTGAWDNSESNRFNPDPKSEVRWGDQSWEEMLVAWISLQIDPNTDVDNLMKRVAP